MPGPYFWVVSHGAAGKLTKKKATDVEMAAICDHPSSYACIPVHQLTYINETIKYYEGLVHPRKEGAVPEAIIDALEAAPEATQ